MADRARLSVGVPPMKGAAVFAGETEAGATGAVAFELAVDDPPAFVPVATMRSVEPTSALVST